MWNRLVQTQPQLYSAHLYLANLDLAANAANDGGASVRELKIAAGLRRDPGLTALAEAADAAVSGGHAAMLQAMLSVRKNLFAQGKESAYDLAVAYAAVNDEVDAVAYLKLSVARHEPENIGLSGDTRFATLRRTPEFRHLLRFARAA